MEHRLTAGAVERILNNQQVDKPVLQVLNFKPISSNTADRYRLLLSDGVQCHTYAMLGTQLNCMINNNEIDKFAVVQLDKYMCNVVSPDKKVLIVLDLTVIAKGSTVGCRLGNPVIPTTSSSGAAQPTDGGANKAQFQHSGGQAPPSAAPSFGNRAYPASTSDVVVVPIASLTPYQNRWTIRVRVTNKSNIRTWSNSKGEGKLFSMDLLDESGEIRATAFNAECDRLYDIVEVNKVYYISRAVIKNVRQGYSFSSIKNDFEMSFIPETTITPCDDVTPNIPTLQFNFVPIPRLQEVSKDSVIDVIGVCKSASDIQTVTRRTTNQELKKRDISLVDRSGTEVSLTLWGDQAEKFDGTDNPVVAVKGVRVSDFSGVSLSLIGSSMLQLNPDIPESHALMGWYSREGMLLQTRSLSTRSGGPMGGGNSNWKSIAQAKAEGLGKGDKPDYYSVKACVSIIRKENCLYKACPSENCNKKVVDLQNGYYRCEKCAQETMDFKWRLLVSANLTDFSDGQWVTCFGKEAEMLIGASAEDLGDMYSKSSKEDCRYDDILNEVPFKPFIFRLRTKMEVYNDESRLKTSVMSVAPVNCVEYTQKLLKDIAELNKSL
ncbi:replication protein A 70 kDa DNA-binding subunit [Dermacentor albipictus]|uniref:replication protein A 70 kDa DNA-binding subunit n=1 Tax=Dermacentor albipictus TaxID=60249 RepID=UPI0038FC7353